jgi:hypothetical protein
MEMIGHETGAEELDGVLGFRRGEQVEKCGLIAVLVEDRGATVATIQHMVDVSGHLSARNPRHGESTVRETGAGTQEKVACPLFLVPMETHSSLVSTDHTTTSLYLAGICLTFR